MRRTNLLLLLVVTAGVFFLNTGMSADVKFNEPEGAKDHPAIPRFPSAFIVEYHHKNFDEFSMPLSYVSTAEDDEYWDDSPSGDVIKKLPAAWKVLEGEITIIRYMLLGGHSSLEVYMTYKEFLKQKGFTVLLALNNKGAGWFGPGFGYFRAKSSLDNWRETHRFGEGDNPRYIVAKKGNLNVAIGAQDEDYDDKQYVAVWINVVQEKNLNQSMVQLTTNKAANNATNNGAGKPASMSAPQAFLNAGAIAGAIKNSGKASIYGIQFDAGKNSINPKSLPELKEIADFLEHNSAVNMYIVDHTDDSGHFDSNMKLSGDRAKEVVKILVNKYKVAPNRLKAFGVGSLVPLAPNDTAKGRALNCRVELVKASHAAKVSVTNKPIVNKPNVSKPNVSKPIVSKSIVSKPIVRKQVPSKQISRSPNNIPAFDIKQQAVLAAHGAGNNGSPNSSASSAHHVSPPPPPAHLEKLVAVPRVTGKFKFVAKHLLGQKGFRVVEKGKKVGKVTSQSPAADTKVKPGSQVTITIGK